MLLRLINTTAFRISLVYALVFSLISTGAISFIYWNSAKEIRAQTDSQLSAETNALLSLYNNGKINALTQEMNQLNTDGRSKFFLYALLNRNQRDLIEEIAPEKRAMLPGDNFFATVPLNTVITAPDSQKKQFTQPARVLLTLLPEWLSNAGRY